MSEETQDDFLDELLEMGRKMGAKFAEVERLQAAIKAEEKAAPKPVGLYIIRLKAERDRLRSALGKVEWDPEWGDCLWCGRNRNNGHAPTCTRQLALNPQASD